MGGVNFNHQKIIDDFLNIPENTQHSMTMPQDARKIFTLFNIYQFIAYESRRYAALKYPERLKHEHALKGIV